VVKGVLDDALELSELLVEIVVVFDDLFQLDVLVRQFAVDFALPVFFELGQVQKLEML